MNIHVEWTSARGVTVFYDAPRLLNANSRVLQGHTWNSVTIGPRTKGKKAGATRPRTRQADAAEMKYGMEWSSMSFVGACLPMWSRANGCVDCEKITLPIVTRDGGCVAALVNYGLMPCAPIKPSVTITLDALELYRVAYCRTPHLSIQAFVKTLCDLHGVSKSLFTGYYLC